MPQPDESKFRAMEVAAAASGPEAEARRQEMAEWSEAIGAHAEMASRRVNAAGEEILKEGGTDKEVKERMSNASSLMAEFGVGVSLDEEGKYLDSTAPETGLISRNGAVRAIAEGVRVRKGDNKPKIYRSPAQIAADDKSEQKVA